MSLKTALLVSHGALMARLLAKFAPLLDSRFDGQRPPFAFKASVDFVIHDCIGERSKTYALREPNDFTLFERQKCKLG